MNNPSVNLDLTQVWGQILTFLALAFDWMEKTTISIGNFRFSFLQMFTGSIAITLFAELFIMAFVPGTSGEDFNSDSGEDYIDVDFDE